MNPMLEFMWLYAIQDGIINIFLKFIIFLKNYFIFLVFSVFWNHQYFPQVL